MARTKGAYGLKYRQLFMDDPSEDGKPEGMSNQHFMSRYILYHFGMTMREYTERHAPTHCPICHELLIRADRGTHIDHQHHPFKLRDIICRECNIMIGKARDNPFILINAIKYLNKHSRD